MPKGLSKKDPRKEGEGGIWQKWMPVNVGKGVKVKNAECGRRTST